MKTEHFPLNMERSFLQMLEERAVTYATRTILDYRGTPFSILDDGEFRKTVILSYAVLSMLTVMKRAGISLDKYSDTDSMAIVEALMEEKEDHERRN